MNPYKFGQLLNPVLKLPLPEENARTSFRVSKHNILGGTAAMRDLPAGFTGVSSVTGGSASEAVGRVSRCSSRAVRRGAAEFYVAAGQILGARIGSGMVVARGVKLIKPIFDSVLPNAQRLAFTAWAIVAVLTRFPVADAEAVAVTV